MDELKKVLEEGLKKAPKILLWRAIKKKLSEHGIDDKKAVKAFADHILSDEEETFMWDDGSDNCVKIEFTEQDEDQVLDAVNEFVAEKLPKIVDGSIKDAAKDVARELEKGWPALRLKEKSEARHFSDRIDLRWSKGLDPLRMMLIASHEVGELFAEKITRSKAKKGQNKRQVLSLLHMRACQTTLEIITLLENGLPDGAYARWRTLYEISVVAFFLDRFGDEAARRYIAHDAVSARDSLENQFKFAGELFDPSSLTGEAKRIEDVFVAVVQNFGKSFAGHYGWAASSLGINAPRFKDLEEAVDWGALPPAYKWSSFKVHAGSAGVLRSLGNVGSSQVIHSGATNAGLDTPAINTASSLLQITSLVFPHPSYLETAIQLKALLKLRDRVVKGCTKAASRLEKEELSIRADLENEI